MLAGRPTQGIAFGELLALYADDSTLTPALRGLTLEDVSFFDGTELADASPAGLLLGATPIVELTIDDEPWCDVLAAASDGDVTCEIMRITADTTMLDLDVDLGALPILAALPELRRLPLAENLDVIATGAPVLDARLDELNLFATAIGEIPVTAAVAASPAVASVRVADIPVDDTNPDDGGYGRRDLVVDCSALACAPRDARRRRCRRCARAGGRLQDVGRAFRDHRSQGSPPIAVAALGSALPPAIDLSDVVVGTLDQADFPWEDVDLTSAGLQDFARTGATLDWHLGVSLIGARSGPGPFDTTITVDLPPGFRSFAPSRVRPAPAARSELVPAAGTLTGPAITAGPDGQRLTWTVEDLAVDTDYTLSFRTTPGLELGDARATARVAITERGGDDRGRRARARRRRCFVRPGRGAGGRERRPVPRVHRRRGRRRPVRLPLDAARPGRCASQPPRR